MTDNPYISRRQYQDWLHGWGRTQEVRVVLVCPVTDKPPPPAHVDTDANVREDGTLSPVALCPTCGQPLERRYEDGQGRRL